MAGRPMRLKLSRKILHCELEPIIWEQRMCRPHDHACSQAFSVEGPTIGFPLMSDIAVLINTAVAVLAAVC